LFDSNVVITALLDDIAKRREFAPELNNIDLIFITGDLAYSGKESEYKLVHSFIDELMKITGVVKQSIFMIPGNHDVDRSKISDESRTIINKLGNEQAVNDLLANSIDLEIIMKRLDGYGQFFKEHFNGDLEFDQNHYFYVTQKSISSKNISILGLNSAWAAGSDQDQYNLFLGERQVREAIKHAGSTDLCFVLMHHPFKWLRDSDADICEPLLLDKNNIILHGHLHKTGITLQKTPSASSIIIGAGAGYESRSHLNSYSLGSINSDLGSGALYLRTYSDRDGGFWSADTTSYRNVIGKYNFRFLIKEEIEQNSIIDHSVPAENEVEDKRVAEVKSDNNIKDSAAKKQASIPVHALTTWWKDRGYESDPFLYYNTKDIQPSSILDESVQYWYVDPNLPVSNNGFSRPTIDEIISADTSGPVLIFAPSGGGKTFCRILAMEQAELSDKDSVVEILNITSKLANPERVSAVELMYCIYNAIRAKYDLKGNIPQANYVQHVLAVCDEELKKLSTSSSFNKYVLAFIDDLDQLFSENNAEQNQNVLKVISDLCKAVASQNSTHLALRLFLPMEIKDQLLQNLGVKTRQNIRVVTLRWNVDRCESVLEARLNSYWQYGPNQYEGRHLERLFHQDALDELRRQLKDRPLTPRCVIRLLRELSDYAYHNNLSRESSISSKLIVDFFKNNSFTICQVVQYPTADIGPSKKLDRKSRFEKFTTILNKISTGIRNIINSIANLNDQLGAIKILGITLATVLFFLWLLFQEIWLGQHIDLRVYLKEIWDFIVSRAQ